MIANKTGKLGIPFPFLHVLQKFWLAVHLFGKDSRIRWPERDALMLTPLIRLMWDTLINEFIYIYDRAKGNSCRPVLLLIDEAGVTPIPNLYRLAATVCGRGISLWIAVQALSQLEALYGKHGSETLINNCDSQIYYRQSSQGTAEYLERSLGKESRFAHSQSLYDGEEKSQGLSEQAVSLMTAQEIKQLVTRTFSDSTQTGLLSRPNA